MGEGTGRICNVNWVDAEGKIAHADIFFRENYLVTGEGYVLPNPKWILERDREHAVVWVSDETHKWYSRNYPYLSKGVPTSGAPETVVTGGTAQASSSAAPPVPVAVQPKPGVLRRPINPWGLMGLIFALLGWVLGLGGFAILGAALGVVGVGTAQKHGGMGLSIVALFVSAIGILSYLYSYGYIG